MQAATENHERVTVRFHRDGEVNGVALDPDIVYDVSVDGGPRSEFRSPWTQETLERHVQALRNADPDTPPDLDFMRQIGRELADAVFGIKGLAERLATNPTLYLQLDYPELAGIPWELLTQQQEPFHHLLLEGTAIIRKVAAAREDADATWPTGHNTSLRILYVWGQRHEGDVPNGAHHAALQDVCDRNGVELTAQEVASIDDLTALCTAGNYHFVHVLAHGSRTEKGEWGLRFSDDVVSGEQIARALRAGDSVPALVTLAACDSANDENNTFGSVAYHLHTHGVPLVLASQFRLRKTVSNASVAAAYEEMLAGESPIGVVSRIRRQLSAKANESWANEVLYSRYRHDSLVELSAKSRQQAALRRARAVEKSDTTDPDALIALLEAESAKLRGVAQQLTAPGGVLDRPAVAETYGLLGSMARRIARLRGNPAADLRAAARLYERGFKADRNSYYCGMNLIHLLRRVDDAQAAEALTPIVRYAVAADLEAAPSNYWVCASAGELEVYDGNANGAVANYERFVDLLEADASLDAATRVVKMSSAARQLDEIEADFGGEELAEIRSAAAEANTVLRAAVERNR